MTPLRTLVVRRLGTRARVAGRTVPCLIASIVVVARGTAAAQKEGVTAAAAHVVNLGVNDDGGGDYKRGERES